MSTPAKRGFEFGPFFLDANNHQLMRDGEPVPLTPKVFDTILVLVQNSRRVLDKDELMKRVWPDTIVEENNLSKNISTLRKALGKSPEGREYIETIPKRGYRFVAPVREIWVGAGDETGEEGNHAGKHSLPGTPPMRSGRRLSQWLWLAVVAILFLGGALWFKTSRSISGSALPPVKLVPLTSFPGQEYHPALSPDGREVAFTWNGPAEDNFDIYVKRIGTETPNQLTSHAGYDGGPAWSPDGRSVAFFRFAQGVSGVFIVPTAGGSERKLVDIGAGTLPECEICFGSLSWSPDGRTLAYPDKNPPRDTYSITLLSLDNLEKRQLVFPPVSQVNDMDPAFSPDGRTVAFTRHTNGESGIYLAPALGGSPTRLISATGWIRRLAWTPDGDYIVFSSNLGGTPSLWRIPVSGGEPERLAFGGDNAYEPSIAIGGRGLAFRQFSSDTNIWQLERSGSLIQDPAPNPFIASTRRDIDPQFSPDGQGIAFVSDRSGAQEIWVCDRDGSDPIQLTAFEGPPASTPRWSPDGRQIVFAARSQGHSDLYVLDLSGGPPRRLTIQECDDVAPSWSRDGWWIYFGSDRSGTWQVWKISALGGEAVPVTIDGGYAAFESYGGRSIYYAKYDEPGIWEVPAEGGRETLLLDRLAPGFWGYWAVTDSGVCFIDSESTSGPTIAFFDLKTRQVKPIARVENRPIRWSSGLSVSPDGQWILFTQVDRVSSDLLFVEDFP